MPDQAVFAAALDRAIVAMPTHEGLLGVRADHRRRCGSLDGAAADREA